MQGGDKAVGLPLLFGSQSLFTFKIILQRGEEVANNRDTPGATQDFLPLIPAHVVHVRVVFGEAKDSKRVNHVKNVTKKISYHLICVTWSRPRSGLQEKQPEMLTAPFRCTTGSPPCRSC